MASLPKSISRLIKITKGGSGSGSPTGHTFRGNQWTKYDENGNPIPSERSRRAGTSSAKEPKAPREPKQEKVDPKIQRAMDASVKVANDIRVPEARKATFVANLTKIMTNPEEFTKNFAEAKANQSTDPAGAAILKMIGYTGKPSVVSLEKFNETEGKTYYSGLSTRSNSTMTLDQKMTTLAYGETPRYGGGMFGASFYSSPKMDVPADYATNGSEGGIFLYKTADESNIYNSGQAGNDGMAALTFISENVPVGSNSRSLGFDNPRYGLSDIMKENGYTEQQISELSVPFFDGRETFSTSSSLAGYDGLYVKNNNYLMMMNRTAMIMPDQYVYFNNTDQQTLINNVTPTGLNPNYSGGRLSMKPIEKPTTKSAEEVLEKGESAGHAFRGNQYTTGESGGLSDSSRYRYARSLATKVVNRAIKNEPEISYQIEKAANQIGGTRIKPEFAIKSVSSTTRKIIQQSKDYFEAPKSAVETASTDIHDSLRYTIVLPDAKFADGVKGALESMKSAGFEQMEVKNYFNDNSENSYRGINCNFRDSTTNQVFELQFHTPSSLAMIDAVHPIYEATRVLDKSSDAYSAGQAKMIDLWSSIPIPPNVDGIGTSRVKKEFAFDDPTVV